MYIFIFGFTKVQLTERMFIIYNFKESRCLWNKDSPHFKTSSVRAAALEKLTTLLDHETVEQVRTKFHNLLAPPSLLEKLSPLCTCPLFLISGETRETRWLKWSSSIRRYSLNELRSSVASSRTILWNAPISCLLAIQPLTQTRRFLLLMRAFSSPSKSINARTSKAFFFAKRRHFGLRDVNIIAWELGNRWSNIARNVARNVATV